MYRRARALLSRLAERDALLGRAHELEREQRDAERLASRQAAALQLAAELRLAFAPEAGSATAVVVRTLDEVEQALAQAEADARDTADPRPQLAQLRERLAAVDDRLISWALASQAAHRLAAQPELAELGAATPAAILAIRDRVLEAQRALVQRRAEREAAREQVRLRATALERSGTGTDPELARLRDELGGELLAERFEDLDVEAASWVEARLGPLAGALIVDDPIAAARKLQGGERARPSVWLVAAGSQLDVEPGPDAAPPQLALDPAAEGAGAARVTTAGGDDVVTREPFGVRVTRRVAQPSLGRRARERQVAELYAEVARDGEVIDELTARAAVLAGWRRDAELLAAHAQVWLAGDPTEERARIHADIAGRELAALAFEDRVRSAHARATEARRRRDGLRRLLGDAVLIDGPDHAARAAELAGQRHELAATRLELERVAAARVTLAELADVLRRPPPDDAERAAQAARIAELAGELDRLFLARAALEDVLGNRQAAAWGDAEHALAAESSLAPALERQHGDARAAAEVAEAAADAADAAWEAATAAAHAAEAQLSAATAHRDRAAGELVALGGPPTVREAADQEALVSAAIDYANGIEADLRALVTAAALAAERRDQAARAAEEASARLTAETRAAGPAAAAWAELRETADTAGLLQTALASAAHAGRTSVQLTADAWSKREVLLDRVGRARGGAELADQARALALDGPSYLKAWQLTREWLRHRVPAQVVEVDEPLLALERLRSHLDVLEGRLARQEHDLRGASEDVARGIDIQLRRAGGQVRRLNQHLDGIKFGSVHGIRVELRRIERMEQILRALRLGEAQELLFMSSIPIEEALDEIFRRYGGGRGGGERLLDYREYLELAVQIRRQTSGDWESASPTRLSTGEAIGVGAAVMMVVLTEWERDANLLRARRTSGSLRFLFLDEANRLSRDNLGVLFDLCRTLDLQLLIAAPEVARAEGNTTYRLVRHVADDGREEVLVTGRRAATTAEATTGADATVEATPEAAATTEAAAATEAAATSEADATAEVDATATVAVDATAEVAVDTTTEADATATVAVDITTEADATSEADATAEVEPSH
ncbi:MAG TPA: SbcC/MukB-like Walker B domain-containing protein [Kofleriaceae bacterium]